MLIWATTEPILLRDVADPVKKHPCVYSDDGDHGLEIYFENDENRWTCLETKVESNIVLRGNNTDDYVAGG